MSLELHNQRVLDAVRRLPGRDEDTADCSRGYVGWGPGEDSMCGARSVSHATWQDLLGTVQNPAREVHDFYFEHHVETETCACCAGSGKNRDYAELDTGFYRTGGGRWAGWSERLSQEEIDLLVEKGRIRSRGEKITPSNLSRFLGRLGHDAINRWMLVPVRAKALGISTVDCFDCVGTGAIPTAPAQVRLHAWTFDPAAGNSRTDTALEVPLKEIEEVRQFMAEIGWEGVKRRFGWAVSDNMHPDIIYEDDWNTLEDRQVKMTGLPSFNGRDGAYPSWKHFHSRDDVELNLVFDYRIIAPPEARDEFFPGSELPERFGLRLWMTHPRKGTDVVIAIREMSREEAPELKAYLRRSFDVHGRHFAWAVGREFGNEAEGPEDRDRETDGMARFLPFGA